jgi:phenylalanyl-tRNA synthetase beta chain
MCVIADADRAVALGGIMGGFDSEVSAATTNLLIESAQFAPLAIRNAARSLRLHSPSSYRFERGIDPEGVEWASRRCCELVLELAGGELCEGLLDVASAQPTRPIIKLRFDQLPRVLGIAVPAPVIVHILGSLGCEILDADDHRLACKPPSWRRDLSREIDLIEEVARVHGYDKIPEDVSVPMFPSHRSDADRLLNKVRLALTATGFDEAITISAVPEPWSQSFSPWNSTEPLRCASPVLKGADYLRRSLIPSLLGARAINESAANDEIDLFETAKIYLPRSEELPQELWALALVSGRDFYDVKGILEGLFELLHVRAPLEVEEFCHDLLAPDSSCRLLLQGELLGFLGLTSSAANKLFGLRQSTTIAELNLQVLQQHAVLVPQYEPVISYPAITQDLNFIVAESVAWSSLASTARQSGGELLEQIRYQETYRDPKTDGPGKKRILLSVTLRSKNGTLTTDEANTVRERIVSAVAKDVGGKLLG